MSSETTSKLFYSVGELAEQLDVEPHRIRYWSEEFSQVKPDRSPGGQRQFRERDLEALRTIHQLIEVEKYTLEGAQQQLENREQRPELEQAATSITRQCDRALEEIQNFIEQI